MGHVRCSTGSLHVLLATLLLVLETSLAMSILISDWLHTSNDLLRRLTEKYVPTPAGYHVIAQGVEEVQNLENAPALSMQQYLQESGKTSLLRTISVYSLRGESREQLRLLYMNAPAIRVWRQMGKVPTVIGSQARPPHTALLTFGVPFSE